MKIIVLGATGPAGLEVVKLGLDRGHEIKALVRNPSKLTIQHDRLKAVKVDVMNEDDIAKNIKESDVIISCLGVQSPWLRQPTVTLFTDVTKVVVSAMRKVSVKGFMFLASWYPKPESGNSFFYEWILRPLKIGNILRNTAEAEDYLMAECQDIDFTSVRAPGLTLGPITDKPIKAEAHKCARGAGYSISRADVARFMLDSAENGQWKNTCVSIGV